MSDPQPPQRQPTPTETQSYAKAVHNAALVAVIACPILALLPPRKLDLYTLGLIGGTGYSANYLVRESTGRPVWQQFSGTQRTARPAREESVVAEVPKQGRAREAWKIERQKEIREHVEEGKGFAEMITDQIWEVWNQGKTKDEDDEG